MIDVLCVTTRLCIGGVQTFLINNVKPLLRYDIRLNFIVQDTSPQIYDDYVKKLGCKIFYVTPVSVSKFRFIKDLRRILKENKQIKIIHSHQNFANFYSLLAAYKLPVKISHSHSNYQSNSLFNKLIKSAWKFLLPLIATDFWACSEESAKWLYGKHHKSKNCKIIRNTIDSQKFRFDESKRKLIRKILNIADEETWLHIGSFGEAKNHIFLIDLFHKYKKNNPKTKLILCGEGKLKEDILNKIKQLNLSNDIILTGNVSNPEDYLSAADLFIFPSLFEGFGISVIEAQCNGINCLVSKAIPDDCIINENIIKCSTFSYEEWLDSITAIKKSCVNREDLYKNLIRNGYDIEIESKRIADFYKQSIERNK